MDGVGTPIIGRPRPLPRHDTPNPAYHPHTLNYEEPLYANGWTYGNESRVVHVLRLEPVPAGEGNVQPNTIGVKLQIVSSDGVTCRGQKITVKEEEYTSTLSLFMTWKDGRWIETQGRVISEHEQ